MGNELSIVKYIKEYGLDNAVNTFKLTCKDYGYKILLKYNQIESDMSIPEVQDCRGLILEKDTWKVMSLAFRKFLCLYLKYKIVEVLYLRKILGRLCLWHSENSLIQLKHMRLK